jgi:integrase
MSPRPVRRPRRSAVPSTVGNPLADRTTLREAPSVRDLVKKFESEYLPKLRPSTIREYRALINNEILPALGNLKIASVTHTDVDRLHRQLSAHAPYRANRLAALLSRIFNLAIRWQWRLDNPVKGLERNLEEKRERCLSPSELGRFLDALNAYTNPLACRCYAFVPIHRRAKIRSPRGAVGSIRSRRRCLDQTKQSHQAKETPSSAVERTNSSVALGTDENPANIYIIPSPITGFPYVDLRKPWDAIRRAAGLIDFRIHDLRHSFGSMLVNSGLSLPIIGALLGHSRPETTARYAHLADDPLRQATAQVGQLIENAKVLQRK